ncbi:MAG: TIGR00730 family Rossman fold protein [Bellilinea sp.]|nr:TIGR00730 family Rossman fold protein [Bellilinea sp.]
MNNQKINSLCVFAGSADNLAQSYLNGAAELGKLLAKNHIRVVYGGGKTGLMGALADAALQSGGIVIGVVPRSLFQPQLIHDQLSELRLVEDMHQRKALMSQLADAFIALPGGFGTFDELFETLTWTQIGIHRKVVGLLNINNYFTPLVELIEHARREGFIYSNHRELFLVENDPKRLLSNLRNHRFPPDLDKWVSRSTLT